jgi:hypothetical protein
MDQLLMEHCSFSQLHSFSDPHGKEVTFFTNLGLGLSRDGQEVQ